MWNTLGEQDKEVWTGLSDKAGIASVHGTLPGQEITHFATFIFLELFFKKIILWWSSVYKLSCTDPTVNETVNFLKIPIVFSFPFQLIIQMNCLQISPSDIRNIRGSNRVQTSILSNSIHFPKMLRLSSTLNAFIADRWQCCRSHFPLNKNCNEHRYIRQCLFRVFQG